MSSAAENTRYREKKKKERKWGAKTKKGEYMMGIREGRQASEEKEKRKNKLHKRKAEIKVHTHPLGTFSTNAKPGLSGVM